MLVDLLVMSLATFAITNLLSKESGPLGILTRLRYWAGVRLNVSATQDEIIRWMLMNEAVSVDEVPDRIGTNVLSDILNCSICLSVWVALFVALFYSTDLINYLATALALHAGSMLIESVVYG